LDKDLFPSLGSRPDPINQNSLTSQRLQKTFSLDSPQKGQALSDQPRERLRATSLPLKASTCFPWALYKKG